MIDELECICDWKLSMRGSALHPEIDFLDEQGDVVISGSLGSILMDFIQYWKQEERARAADSGTEDV